MICTTNLYLCPHQFIFPRTFHTDHPFILIRGEWHVNNLYKYLWTVPVWWDGWYFWYDFVFFVTRLFVFSPQRCIEGIMFNLSKNKNNFFCKACISFVFFCTLSEKLKYSRRHKFHFWFGNKTRPKRVENSFEILSQKEIWVILTPIVADVVSTPNQLKIRVKSLWCFNSLIQSVIKVEYDSSQRLIFIQLVYTSSLSIHRFTRVK